MVIMADCRTLQTASGYFVRTLSRHLAFDNRRCLETPWWDRCVARRSIAPCRSLDRRGASVSPRGRRWEACCENLAQSGRDLALRPILSRARLRFRLFDSPRWLLQPNQHRNAQTGLCCISNVRDALDWSASGGLRGMLTATSSPVNAHRTTRGIAQFQTRS